MNLKDERNNNIQVIRLLAAFFVMAGHMGVLIGGIVPGVFFDSAHAVGIKIFFLLGGYLITASWMKDRHVMSYAVKRIFRILPELIFYVLVMTFVLGPFLSFLPFKEYLMHVQVREYLKNIFFYIGFVLPGVFAENIYPHTVNGSLWSLPVEMVMYVMVPIILELTGIFKKYRNQILVFVSLLAIAGMQYARKVVFADSLPVIYHIDLKQAFLVIPFYLIGCIYTIPAVKKRLNLQAASVLLLLSMCIDRQGIVGEITEYIVLSYFIFSLAFSAEPFFAEKMKKLDISYGMFLWGFPIQQIVVQFFVKHHLTVNYMLCLVVSLAVTALFAMVSAKFIGKPAVKLSKKCLQYIGKREGERSRR